MKKSPAEVVEYWREQQAFPGAAYAYGSADKAVVGYCGSNTYEKDSRKIDENSIFDLASMTKVVSTTSIAKIAVDAGEICLNDPISKFIPNTKIREATVQHLLLHNCGIAAYDSRIASSTRTPEEARRMILDATPKTEPGEATAYSCLGFITLQTILEDVLAAPISTLFQKHVAEPLKLRAHFNPNKSLHKFCLPTGTAPKWRLDLAKTRNEGWAAEPYIQARVHDPIAYAMGGISGNAGLFATIEDCVKFAQAILGGKSLFAHHMDHWAKRHSEQSSRALGWDTKSPTGSSAGKLFSLDSFGHTGYTGTCIWVDPKNMLFGVLLSNRVFPDDKSDKIMKCRPEFFDAVFTQFHENFMKNA
ncbi:serine hydrolase domain-containing protein [Kamptonema cortianum]|nr:serine hydrolase domain-containing protein [Geitlerinema splendidum]MDK3158543.1 serine hydrolase domain-containing protein [Kamptonema cortianum]